MNANKGYSGWSMSVRAIAARNEGKMPKTDFKKHYKISEKVFVHLSENDMLETEWHHTSKFFNKTYFYELNLSGIIYLKHLGNETAFHELRTIAQKRLSAKFRTTIIPHSHYNFACKSKFGNEYYSIVINVLFRISKKPPLTPSFVKSTISKIDEIISHIENYKSNRAGRKSIEKELFNYFKLAD